MKKLAFIACLALLPSFLSASPEVDEMDRKTAEALSQAEAGHPAAVEAMNKNYLAALQKLEVERQKEGDLKQLLMVRDDLKAFTESLEIRRGNSFPRLKQLREAYQKEFHKLQTLRLQKRLTLLEAHRTALVNLQKKLTRSDLIAEALEVDKALESCNPRIEKAREELRVWMDVKPEQAVSHLNRKNSEPSEGAHKSGRTAPEKETPPPTPAEEPSKPETVPADPFPPAPL